MRRLSARGDVNKPSHETQENIDLLKRHSCGSRLKDEQNLNRHADE
jgi:hypothetical protein